MRNRLLELLDGEWVFGRGKHVGDTLEKVAEDDGSYLQWVAESATEGLNDDAFHALEIVMEENDIEWP